MNYNEIKSKLQDDEKERHLEFQKKFHLISLYFKVFLGKYRDYLQHYIKQKIMFV